MRLLVFLIVSYLYVHVAGVFDSSGGSERVSEIFIELSKEIEYPSVRRKERSKSKTYHIELERRKSELLFQLIEADDEDEDDGDYDDDDDDDTHDDDDDSEAEALTDAEIEIECEKSEKRGVKISKARKKETTSYLVSFEQFLLPYVCEYVCANDSRMKLLFKALTLGMNNEIMSTKLQEFLRALYPLKNFDGFCDTLEAEGSAAFGVVSLDSFIDAFYPLICGPIKRPDGCLIVPHNLYY